MILPVDLLREVSIVKHTKNGGFLHDTITLTFALEEVIDKRDLLNKLSNSYPALSSFQQKVVDDHGNNRRCGRSLH